MAIDHHPLKFVILGYTGCTWCDKAADLINERGHTAVKLLYDKATKQGNPLYTFLYESDLKTVPQIFINGWLLGGYEALEDYLNSVSPCINRNQLPYRSNRGNGGGLPPDCDTYQFNF